MRPRSAVLRYGSDGHFMDYALYFSEAKARRAYQDALVRDSNGWSTLYFEDGGISSTTDATYRIVEFGNDLKTSEDRFRTGFLNLSELEVEELVNRFQVPRELIKSAAQLERDVAERKWYDLSRYDERTKARLLKFLPRFLLRRIFYG